MRYDPAAQGTSRQGGRAEGSHRIKQRLNPALGTNAATGYKQCGANHWHYETSGRTDRLLWFYMTMVHKMVTAEILRERVILGCDQRIGYRLDVDLMSAGRRSNQ